MSSMDHKRWWICKTPGCNTPGAYYRFKAPNTGRPGSKPRCPCCGKSYNVKGYTIGMTVITRQDMLTVNREMAKA